MKKKLYVKGIKINKLKKLPIGISDFKELIEKNYYYVDKSLFIEEILEDGAKVILLPRPRRFGKTLNISMLRYFLEKIEKNNSHLFKNLAISKNKEIMKQQGTNPIIFITFKDVKVSTWKKCLEKLTEVIAAEYRRHRYVLESEVLDKTEKNTFISIITKKASETDLESSLKNLSEYLYRYHKKKPFILIDEYDTPIQSGYLNDYKKDVIEFMRNLLCGGLKDNEFLEKGILTGILRVSKENIFSGLNNLAVHGLINNSYADKFGLMQDEVTSLAKKISGKNSNIDEIKSWYNGYKIGNKTTVYNPWSIVNFLYNNCEFGSYWVNTSDNALINTLISKGSNKLKKSFELLIAGKSIDQPIDDNIIFDQLPDDIETVWSLLLFSGYLTYTKKELIKRKTVCTLKIPNEEIITFFEKAILLWFKAGIGSDKFDRMLSCLISGDVETFTELFQGILISNMSYFDVKKQDPERVYHAFVLGMLISLLDSYEVKSNKESGIGRYDVMIIPKDLSKLGIVIEFKVAKAGEKSLKKSAKDALKQIETKHYIQELNDREIKNKLLIGMSFRKKRMAVEYKFLEK